ncbi:IS66 family transposase [Skermanella mucosa]|uniref:IS66 family transposase n=1 Tax=Skermanella mucosa TaxID=1789672 RepID=UPI003899C384
MEREITGRPAEERRRMRQERRRGLVEAFQTWCEDRLRCIPGKGGLSTAMCYFLKRVEAFSLFIEDGRVAIGPLGNAKRYNNPAERAVRPISTNCSL